MNARQLIVLGAVAAGLFLIGRRKTIATILRGGGFDEVRPGVAAIKDAQGRYIRCENVYTGEVLPNEMCAGCSFEGCPPGSTGQDPGDEYEEDEDNR